MPCANSIKIQNYSLKYEGHCFRMYLKSASGLKQKKPMKTKTFGLDEIVHT